MKNKQNISACILCTISNVFNVSLCQFFCHRHICIYEWYANDVTTARCLSSPCFRL